MESLLDLFLHFDRHLTEFVASYGAWVYAMLFLVVFAETGLVVTPFLPGDSLLFAVGALSAAGGLNATALSLLVILAFDPIQLAAFAGAGCLEPWGCTRAARPG